VREQLVEGHLDFIGSHFHGGTLIDQFDCQNESRTIPLLDQDSVHSPHWATFDAHFSANNELSIWFNSMFAKVRTEKLDF
jgi:hypothetical protein